MSEVVIFTVARDDHACLVDAALVALGVTAKLICQTSLPADVDVSVRSDGGAVSVTMGEAGFSVSDVTAFWNRRRAASFALPANCHPADTVHIEHNWIRALEGVAVLLDERFAVNRLAAALVTSSKLNQLQKSRACGLTAPPWLVSNDLQEVIRFSGSVGALCMKPLAVHTWLSEGIEARSLTAIIEAPHRLDPASVGLMPAIYQAYVSKDYEVRITLFGAVVVATRINLSSEAREQIDWRVDNDYLERLEPIVPPEAVVEACRRLMRCLDLRFGTFDFIVTPSGQWVFLEVNESGQFIWQEQFCPEQRVIEPFARFLAAADPAFAWRGKSSASLGFDSLASEIVSNARYRPIRSGAVSSDARHWTDETASLRS